MVFSFWQQKHFHCHLSVLEQRQGKALSPGQMSKPDTESSLLQPKTLAPLPPGAHLPHWDARHISVVIRAAQTHGSSFKRGLPPMTLHVCPLKLQRDMNKKGSIAK